MAEKEKETKYMVLDQADTDSMKALAVELGKFIKENRLFTNVGGKEFVNVEGWQYAGSRLGLTSYTEEVWDISNETEIKYKAQVVVVRLSDGMKVGQGFAVCSNKEQGKKYYQEYAIISMAQTRGVGKAYRLFLAQLIRMAGFEPTPAEEMDGYDSSTGEAAASHKAKSTSKAVERHPETVVKTEQTPPTENGAGKPTLKQREALIRELNNEHVTSAEKAKMLANIDKMDSERMATAHAKLRDEIKKREEAAQSAPKK